MDLKIALLAGDGIGPEVIREAVKVSNSIAKKFNHKIIWSEGLVGAAAIELTGDPYPEETHKICLNSDAVLFGAVVTLNMIIIQQQKFDPKELLRRGRIRFVCKHKTNMHF